MRTASHALASSISGTCLYAAAWKTSAGEYWCITWFTRSGLLMSPTMLATGISGKSSRNCSSTLYIAYSFISKSTSIDGWNAAICRQSSLPMDPPAPVTMNDLAR